MELEKSPGKITEKQSGEVFKVRSLNKLEEIVRQCNDVHEIIMKKDLREVLENNSYRTGKETFK